MRTIEIRKVSITDLDTDAIVNAANEELLAGGGVCGAIFNAAGYEKLQEACDRIGHCDTGRAVITPGFDLKAKYVIHAVGPIWTGGSHGEPEKLHGAYTSALKLALEHGLSSIGFPLISAGIYGYPMEDAWNVALEACAAFLDEHRECGIDIVFAVLDDEIIRTGRTRLIRSSASGYKIAEKEDAEKPGEGRS